MNALNAGKTVLTLSTQLLNQFMMIRKSGANVRIYLKFLNTKNIKRIAP